MNAPFSGRLVCKAQDQGIVERNPWSITLMLTKPLLAAGALLLALPVMPALACDDDYYHAYFESQLENRDHQRFHGEFDEAHERAHEEGFSSGQEHRDWHRAYGATHERFHEDHPFADDNDGRPYRHANFGGWSFRYQSR
jgi:hypothetical protein